MGELELKVQRVLTDPAAPVKAAQNFQFTRVGEELQLDVGYFDMPNLKEIVDKAKKGETVGELLFIVTDRFSLSRTAFEVLSRNVRVIEKSLEAETEKPEAGNAPA